MMSVHWEGGGRWSSRSRRDAYVPRGTDLGIVKHLETCRDTAVVW